MDTVKTIANHVERLPLSLQAEVLNFVEYIIYKNDFKLTTKKKHEWSTLSNEIKNEQTNPSQDKPVLQPKTHRSILELRGLGKHLWQDISVKDYINTERDSWNG
ncbi:hypothetical protein [Candidatus Parabeggiatoa sp. HSG14]|uniref:hypothetical protein n=1 Tax=Candidatus Parabeggiatoa sp. HSG14 TaxID=3055593 RepID=UPI0025A6ADEB|nr:hypothetical protein [Thiotrichales bacterium HSG14]